MSETTAPYGTGPTAASSPPMKRVRTHHLRDMKERGARIRREREGQGLPPPTGG